MFLKAIYLARLVQSWVYDLELRSWRTTLCGLTEPMKSKTRCYPDGRCRLSYPDNTSTQHPLCKLSPLKYLDAEELYSCCVFGVSICLSVFLFLIQCLCACHVTPGPATNWVSSSSSFLPLNLLSHYFPSSPPLRTSLHRCLSIALSTAWGVPLSAGCMVVLF